MSCMIKEFKKFAIVMMRRQNLLNKKNKLVLVDMNFRTFYKQLSFENSLIHVFSLLN